MLKSLMIMVLGFFAFNLLESSAIAGQFRCESENIKVIFDTDTESVQIDDGTDEQAVFTVSEFRKHPYIPFEFTVFGHLKAHLYDWRDELMLHSGEAYFKATSAFYSDEEVLTISLLTYEDAIGGYNIVPKLSTSNCVRL